MSASASRAPCSHQSSGQGGATEIQRCRVEALAEMIQPSLVPGRRGGVAGQDEQQRPAALFAVEETVAVRFEIGA
jgi:hypothetical protein